MKHKQFENKYQYKESPSRKWEKPKPSDYGKFKEKLTRKREWTPEDQAFEDILWAS